MNETPILFPITQSEFWIKIKSIIEEVVTKKLNEHFTSMPQGFSEKLLLKVSEVCTLFSVSKPTLYEWIKQSRLKSFKIHSRRYFLKSDIESLITGKPASDQLSEITSKF